MEIFRCRKLHLRFVQRVSCQLKVEKHLPKKKKSRHKSAELGQRNRPDAFKTIKPDFGLGKNHKIKFSLLRKMSKRNNWGESDSNQRLGSMNWELGQMCALYSDGDIVATAIGERFTFQILANKRVYVKDVDISNRGLNIEISEEMENIMSLEEKIRDLEERNRQITEALLNIQQNQDE